MGRSLPQFISDERAAGKTDSQIVHDLLSAGWHMDIIHRTLHTEPVRKRQLEPILKQKNPHMRLIIGVSVAIVALILLALFI